MATDDNINVKFGASTGELESGIDAVKDKLKEVGEAVVAAFAVDKLAEFAAEMAEIGQQMERMAAMTGLAVGQVEDFQDTIKVMGGNTESAAMSLMRLERNISEAAAKADGPAADAFHRLGVSQDAIVRGNVLEIMGQMAVKMGEAGDGANKLAAMMQVAGRGGMQLIEYFDHGAEGIKQIQESLDSAGPAISVFALQFEQSAQAGQLTGIAFERLGAQIYSVLEPAFDAVNVGVKEFVANISSAISKNESFVPLLQGLGVVIEGISLAVVSLGAAFLALADIVGGACKFIGDMLGGVALAIEDISHRNFRAAAEDMKTAFHTATEDLKKGLNDAGLEATKTAKIIGDMMDTAAGKKPAGTGVGGGSTGTDKIAPPNEKSDQSAINQEYAMDRQLYAEDYAVQHEQDLLKVASRKMTYDQMIADLQTALTKEQQLTHASFQAQMDDYEGSEAGFQRLKQQQLIADEKFQIAHDKLTQDMAKNDNKAWDSAFKTIERSMDQMVSGVLQGTQTMGQAFQRLAQNLVISMIESFAKTGLEWAKTQIQMVAASIAGDQAKVASQVASTAEGKSISDAAHSSEIMKDAYGAAAGAYNALAGIPIIGPFIAPIAAGVAFGAVAAYDSFDVGTPYVPSDQMAMIHQGEAILPRGVAQSWRDGDMGGGGDTHVHFNVNAMDAKSFAGFLSQHSDTLAKSVRSSVRNGKRF